MTFDSLLKEVGEFGFFQKVFICGYVHAGVLLMATAYWVQVYILLVPPHRCKASYEDTTWFLQNPVNSSGASLKECYLNVSEIHNISNNSACPFGWVYDYSHLYPSFPSEHDWVCDNSWRIYTIHAFYWIGSVAGYALFGSLSDRIGRKRSFMGCICLMTVGDIGSYFANDFMTFLIARFVSAIGEANLGTCCFVFAIEYAGPNYRVAILAVWSLSFTLGSTVLPYIVYVLADWQYILIFTWCISAVSLIVTSFVPESASWLVTRGRIEDAAKCVQQVAKWNGKPISLHRIKEFLIKTDCVSDEPKKAPADNELQSEKKVEQMPFLQATIGLFRTPNMRKKTILAMIIWMLATMCYVGNSLETTNLPLPFPLSYVVGGMAEIPANIICLLTLDRIGRRWANAIFFTIGGILGIIAGGFMEDPVTVVVLVTIMRMCNAANFQISFTMSSELFPTIVRGRGVSITRIFGGLACAVSPFIFSLSERGKLLPVLVFGILCVIGGILTLFLPEPAGQHLPHTLEDGENFGKTQSFFYCPFAHRRENKLLEFARYLDSFKCFLMTIVWYKILVTLDHRDKVLQVSGTTLDVEVTHIDSLTVEIKEIRNKVDHVLSAAKLVVNGMVIDLPTDTTLVERRQKKKTRS